MFNIHKGKFYLTGRDIPNNLLTNLTDEEKSVINKCIEEYGRHSGAELSSMTHQEEPWLNARKDIKDSQNCNRKISKRIIREYYRNN